MLRGFTRSTEIRLLKFEYMPFFLQNSALGIHERLPIVEQRAAQLWDEKNSVGALHFHKFLFFYNFSVNVFINISTQVIAVSVVIKAPSLFNHLNIEF